MKMLILILSIVSLPVLADDTNWLVKFYPDNQPYTGCTNYPAEVVMVDDANIPPGWSTNISSLDGWNAYMAAVQPAYALGISNAMYLLSVKRAANLDRLLQLYDLIPQGRAGCSNSATTLAIIEASLASGTNTQSQVVNRIRQLNQEANSLNTRQSYILEYLQRLGPELKALYKPDQDTAQ